jgi:hypothetical protein
MINQPKNQLLRAFAKNIPHKDPSSHRGKAPRYGEMLRLIKIRLLRPLFMVKLSKR